MTAASSFCSASARIAWTSAGRYIAASVRPRLWNSALMKDSSLLANPVSRAIERPRMAL